MAKRVLRPVLPGYFFFEAILDPNEILVIPIHRSNAKTGSSTVTVMAATGAKISYTAEHPVVLDTILAAAGGLPYLSNSAGSNLPATPNPDNFARFWKPDVTIAGDNILEIVNHMTVMRITMGATAGPVVIYGIF